MEYNFAVEFSVRKGLGPEWVTKIVNIGYDDIEPGIAFHIIQQWAIADAKQYLIEHDCPVFVFIDIYNA